jgi:hypothetical protein
MRTAIETLAKSVIGRLTILPPEAVTGLVAEMADIYSNEQRVKDLLEQTSKLYSPQS